VDVHVRWLRQKIETDPANPKHLLTIRGTGYKIEK
jgi:two-component system, OmpR family, response regulator